MKVMRALVILGLAFQWSCKSPHSDSGSDAKAIVAGGEDESFMIHDSNSHDYMCFRTCPLHINDAIEFKDKLYSECKLNGGIEFKRLTDSSLNLTYPDTALDLIAKAQEADVHFQMISDQELTTMQELIGQAGAVPNSDCTKLVTPTEVGGSGGPDGGAGGGPDGVESGNKNAKYFTVQQLAFKNASKSNITLKFSIAKGNNITGSQTWGIYPGNEKVLGVGDTLSYSVSVNNKVVRKQTFYVKPYSAPSMQRNVFQHR
jgi:hypothetical protein